MKYVAPTVHVRMEVIKRCGVFFPLIVASATSQMPLCNKMSSKPDSKQSHPAAVYAFVSTWELLGFKPTDTGWEMFVFFKAGTSIILYKKGSKV